MKYSLDILNWQAIAPGITDASRWEAWAAQDVSFPLAGELAKSQTIPMMTARRMSPASRLAVETSLNIMDCNPVDMAIFTSRHGELDRTYKILQSLAVTDDISPTDFSMSVHNTAAGWLTIAGKKTLPVTSLAASEDSFQQGILEAIAMLHTGAERVLLVDFDAPIPQVYSQNAEPISAPYAVALLLSKGSTLSFERLPNTHRPLSPVLPQSLQFLRGWLNKKISFYVAAQEHQWQWTSHRGE